MSPAAVEPEHTEADCQEYLHKLQRDIEVQACIVEQLKSITFPEDAENVEIAGQSVTVSEHVTKALADLTSVEPYNTDLPIYSLQEIQASGSYDESESFSVVLGSVQSFADIMTIESLTWIAFAVQLARYDQAAAEGVHLRAVPFKTIFDDVQATKVEMTEEHVELHFHWVRRFSQTLIQEALASEHHTEVQEEEPLDPKKELVDHVRAMMAERESGVFVSNIDRYA